jgi:Ig domain of plant-specific actin-binding protein
MKRTSWPGRVAASALAAAAVVVATTAAGVTNAAPKAAPAPTGEPQITGTPRVGAVQRASRGSWSGTTPMTFTYRWFRCQGRGLPDASDCRRIAGAAADTYVTRQADAGFRLRVRVTATNVDGSASSTSNPTEVIQSAQPVNTSEPTISGTPTVGSRLTANRGTWVGGQPITYSFQWLRCSASGDNCAEIVGATDNTYAVTESDAGRSLRVRVTARNDAGTRSALSNPRAVTQQPQPPASFVDVQSLKAAGDRLIVAQVRFSPNPVTSRVTPITARIQVTDTKGRPVRGALVFIRSVPRRTTGGNRQPTGTDGWVTYQLQPLPHFPAVIGNVQFFVKAYRTGDPPLGGIAGYRLVQVGVRTAL